MWRGFISLGKRASDEMGDNVRPVIVCVFEVDEIPDVSVLLDQLKIHKEAHELSEKILGDNNETCEVLDC